MTGCYGWLAHLVHPCVCKSRMIVDVSSIIQFVTEILITFSYYIKKYNAIKIARVG